MITKIFRFLTTTSIWIAFCSVFRVALLAQVAAMPFDPRLGLAVGLDAFAVYLYDKITSSSEDQTNTPERAALARYPMWILVIFALFVAMLLCLSVDYTKLPYLLFFWVAGWLYAKPIAGVRPKDIPGAKTIIVAGASTICYSGIIGAPGWIYLLGFLIIALDTNLFDLRDIKGDTLAGVRSIPVLLGREKTLIFLCLLDVAIAMFDFSIALFGGLLIFYFRKERPNLMYDLLVDGWMLWVFLLRYLFIH